jgi:glucokinase
MTAAAGEPTDWIGIDIGGTKCVVARATATGAIEAESRFATTGVHETLERILAEIEKLAPGKHPRFGVACGGPLDAENGIILSPPNLPGWDRVPIVRELTGRFGGHAWLMNDANAGALAEWRFGAGRGARNLVFLTHGTGMGAGLILAGRLYEGTTGDAGEAGHVRLAETGPAGYGKEGSFEGFCSGGGIARLAAGRLPGIPAPSAREVAAAAAAGMPEARAVLRESGRYLGRALAMLIDILNPERIVLGSIYCRAGRFLEASMREELRREALPGPLAACRIVGAELGERLGPAAALSVALYRSGHKRWGRPSTAGTLR